MRLRQILVAISCLPAAVTSHAQTGAPSAVSASAATATPVYSRPHDMLVEAIRTGNAAGEMQGKVAELFTRQFKLPAKLYARAQVLHGYERDGCRRLRMQYTRKIPQAGTDVPQDFVLNTELNYCADGRTPTNLGAKT